MKSALNQINLKSLVLVVLSITTLSLFGQTVPQIDIQFANPSYDRDTRTYALDVEVKSMTEPEMLYGIDVRFFYDASLLQYKGIDQFHPSYGFLGEAPHGIVGTPSSGSVLFGFENAAGYINGPIQLFNQPNPLHIQTNEWSKVFRVTFKVPVTTYNKASFCPSVIWDKEIDPANGGFINGGEGVVIAVVERDRSTRTEIAIATTHGHAVNWEYFSESVRPFGEIAPTDCIPVTKTILTEEQDKSHVEGYEIFQNSPNPFEGETSIEFTLPSAQGATLVFYDVDGVIKETIEGHYERGRNKVLLKKKQWMVESGVIYYRLQTEKYTSRTIPMTLVRA